MRARSPPLRVPSTACADLDRRIGIAALDQAAPSDLAFLDKAKYAPQLSLSMPEPA